MAPFLLQTVQDTTVVALARDGFASFAAWAMGAMALAFLALLVVVLLVLTELRRLSAAWTDFLAATGNRYRPLIEHVTSAARNADRISASVRSEVDRLGASFGGVASGIDEASSQLQKRLKDLLALVDLAQSEAEDAVLTAAAKVRMIRSGAGGILGLSQLTESLRARAAEAAEEDGAPETGDDPQADPVPSDGHPQK